MNSVLAKAANENSGGIQAALYEAMSQEQIEVYVLLDRK